MEKEYSELESLFHHIMANMKVNISICIDMNIESVNNEAEPHVSFGCPIAVCLCDVQYNACLATCVLAIIFCLTRY